MLSTTEVGGTSIWLIGLLMQAASSSIGRRRLERIATFDFPLFNFDRRTRLEQVPRLNLQHLRELPQRCEGDRCLAAGLDVIPRLSAILESRSFSRLLLGKAKRLPRLFHGIKFQMNIFISHTSSNVEIILATFPLTSTVARISYP